VGINPGLSGRPSKPCQGHKRILFLVQKWICGWLCIIYYFNHKCFCILLFSFNPSKIRVTQSQLWVKLRIFGRLNLLVSQPFLYIWRVINNSNGEVTTQEYDYNISYIVCLQYFLYRYINMPPQAEGGWST